MGRGTDNMIARNTSMRSGLDPAQAMRKYDRAVEQVQILVGERGPSDGSQMAVLRGDVMGGGQPADLQSTQITPRRPPPTTTNCRRISQRSIRFCLRFTTPFLRRNVDSAANPRLAERYENHTMVG